MPAGRSPGATSRPRRSRARSALRRRKTRCCRCWVLRWTKSGTLVWRRLWISRGASAPGLRSREMNRELLMLVDAISREKNVERDVVFGAVEAALAQATKKLYQGEV